MKKPGYQRRIVLLVVCTVVFFTSVMMSSVVNAHQTYRPAAIFCGSDICDGVNPDATRGGSNCPTTGLVNVETQIMYDAFGVKEAELHLFESTYCNTYWAAIFTSTTYMGSFSIYTERVQTTEDQVYYSISKTFPNYASGTWYNVGMVGQDNESPQDCFFASAQYVDRYGYQIHVQTGTHCR